MSAALDPAAFRRLFPEFESLNGEAISVYWDMATGYMSADNSTTLTGASLQLAMNLLTAHVAKLFDGLAQGQTSGVVTGATEGSVSVSLAPPPTKSGWQHWLSTTPYGLQLWSLLQVKSAGGFYIGGSCERGAFRKAGGVF